jgi:ribose transport system permease protein
MLKKDLGLLGIIIVVCTITAILNPLFLSPINIANTANLVGQFGLLSIAQGFVIITGGIELSVGSMVALLGVIFIDLIAHRGVPWPIAVAVIMVLSLLFGIIHGFLISKVKLQPFVVTLCGLLIYRGVARFYTSDGTAGFPFGASFPDLKFLTTGRTDFVALITNGDATSIPVPHSFLFMIIVAVVMGIVLHRSVFGRYLYAVGKNEEAARYSGIRTTQVIIAAYVICAMLTGLSAIFFAMYVPSILPSSHGNFYELYAIAACVLGGFSLRGGEGSIVGLVLGTILLQVLQNIVNMLHIPSSLVYAVMGSVILIGVLADQVLAALRERRRTLEAARRVAIEQPAE